MIMKTMKIFAAMMASVLAFSCVQKDEIVPQAGSVKVEMSFDLNTPDTKVAFDDQEKPQLQWTGTETMALIFGKYGEGGADNKVITTLPATSKGVFSGTVTVPEGFDITDLQGFVVPAENEPWFNWKSATEGRIKMNCPIEQTQAKAGEPNWTYSPFFYDLSGTITDASQTSFTFSDVTVMSAADMVKFNIYGKHPEMAADEVLESITVHNTQNTCTGTAEYVLRSGSTSYNNNPWYKDSKDAPVVTLTEKLTIADKTAENGIEVYMSVIGKSTRKFDQITVVTNKATYVKQITTQNISGKKVNTFNVYQAGVNMASGFERFAATPMYSPDGGKNWDDAMPETFNALSISGPITEEDMALIKENVDSQEAPVALDFSASVYESTVFPATFKGDKNLKAIKFPYNVNEVAQQAFDECTSLEEVDLSTITRIQYRAFRKTALSKVRLDQKVAYLGKEAFRCCYYLEEIYFNVPSSATADAEGPFRWDKEDKTEPKAECVVTVGPDSYPVSYFISDNRNVVKLIIEYNAEADAKIGGNTWNRSYNMHTVIMKGTNGMLYGASGAAVGQNVTGEKYFVVPDGYSEKYMNFEQSTSFYKAFVNTAGFTLIEQSAYDALGK